MGHFVDRFDDDHPAGQVIGSRNPKGMLRHGEDVEGVIGIDYGALRIQPPVQPGWGRTGIAYGPYKRVNGLTFGAFLLNGHNTSQTGDLLVSLPKRVLRWMRGSGTDSVHRRLARWTLKGNKQVQTRQLRRWVWIARHHKNDHTLAIDENLALGWFPGASPADPLSEGNSFIVHATGAENGELWTRIGDNTPPVVRGLQNIPIYYVVVLRENGAAYYAASLPGARGLGDWPNMRPLAIDPFNRHKTVYAAIYQSVLGQIGFRVDSRVYSTQVEEISALGNWYGTAHAADQLDGSGSLEETVAEKGGSWTILDGGFRRTDAGLTSTQKTSAAMLNPGETSGLIHFLIETEAANDAVGGLLWRYLDQANYWCLQIGSEGCQLLLKLDGLWTTIASDDRWRLKPHTPYSIQALDDGEFISLYVNGELLFGSRFNDRRLQAGAGVGLQTQGAQGILRQRSFEAHPRAIPLPTELELTEPWNEKGGQVVVSDHFEGQAGDLNGRMTSSGGKVWQKTLGNGIFDATGDGTVRVRASAQSPNPNRTAYTVEWGEPSLADLQVDITPPGTERGQLEMGRSGLIFWQDADNYIIVNTWIDDVYEGASISSFFYLRGYEDLFDAVWTNVGRRIHWGVPYNLRMVFDGLNYTVFVDDEPVLYRALTDVYPGCEPLKINRVGIVANWEWGNDSGSLFEHFIARRDH